MKRNNLLLFPDANLTIPGENGLPASVPTTPKGRYTRVTVNQLRALIERQCYRCALSGRPLTPDTAALDHKVPFQQGGTNDISNLWVLHVDVNKAKHTMMPSEFIQMCRDVVSHVDHQVDATCLVTPVPPSGTSQTG